LYITGITHTATEEELRKLFSPYGQIVKALIVRDPVTQMPRGFGFVEFETHESAEAALNENGTEFLGSPLRVIFARPQQPKIPQRGMMPHRGGYTAGSFRGVCDM